MVLLPSKLPKETPEETRHRKIVSSRRNYVTLMCYFANDITHIARKLFYRLFRCSHQRSWQNTPQEGKNFATTIGRVTWATGSRRQKLLIESGESLVWDFKLLTHIIFGTNFGPGNNLSEELVLALRSLNDLHRGCLPLCDVITDRDTWDAINQQLKPLVAKFDSYVNIRESRAIAEETAEEMKNNGNDLINLGKFTIAIDSYTLALGSTRCKQQLAKIYANRSAAYLLAPNKHLPEDSRFKMALEDAKRAISLHPEWFRGHQRLGNVYMALKKYKKAYKCFTTALALDKTQEIIVEDLKNCQRELEELPPDGAVAEKFKTNMAELTTVLAQKFGPHLSLDELCEEMFRSSNDPDPEVSVFHAQCVLEGKGKWMLKDEDCAFQMLREVAERASDFAGALYLIGLMAASGFVTDRNPELAFNSFVEAANKPPKLCDDRRNVGVNEAEYEVGCCFEKSIGISGHLATAVDWFARAAENGSNDAAIRLGLFYAQGRGVERNLVTAEYYSTMAAERNSEMAMRKMAAHCSPGECGDTETENNNLLEKIEVGEKEKQDSVVPDDKQSAIRILVDTHPDFVDVHRRFQKFPTRRRYSMFSYDYSDSLPLDIDLQRLESAGDSLTVRDLRRAVNHFLLAADLLFALDENNYEAMIHQLAQCLRISGAILDWNPTFHKAAMALVLRMFGLIGDDKSQLDSDLRVCYVLVLVNEIEPAMEFYEESMKKYPDDAFFPRLLCNALGSIYRYERAIEVAADALTQLPDDVELLYCKAENLRRFDHADLDKTIEAFYEFLRTAPSDHRLVAEACFKMAECLRSNGGTGGDIRKYFRLGSALENERLTFFPPVEENLKTSIASQMTVLSSKRINIPEVDVIVIARSAKLLESERVDLIKAHREAILCNVSHVSRKVEPIGSGFKPSLDAYVSLTLRDVELDAEYEGFVLNCVVIDDPVITDEDVRVIIEDENGDVACCRVVVVLGDAQVRERLGFGCSFGIVNPHIEDVDEGKEVYMDDLDCFVVRGARELGRCRFCGNGGVGSKCSICKKGYCGRECQVNDWKILNHKVVCRPCGGMK